jgi:hypothetical protein
MRAPAKGQGNKIDPAKTDITAALPDSVLQRILLAIPEAARAPCSLVCQRWLRAVGKLQRTLHLLDWQFLESGRLALRFPNLTELDLTWACMQYVRRNNTSVMLAMPRLKVPLCAVVPREDQPFTMESGLRSQQISTDSLNKGLAVLAAGCPDLQRLRLVDVSNNHVPGASFSEWEFVSANEKAGQKAVQLIRDVGDDSTLAKEVEISSKDLNDKPTKDTEMGWKEGEARNGEARNGEHGIKDEGMGQERAGDEQKVGANEERLRGPVTDSTETEVRNGSLNGVSGGKNLTSSLDGEGKIASEAKVGGALNMERDVDGELGKKGDHLKGSFKGSLNQGEAGLVTLGKGCSLLQELEIYQCTDETITSIVAFQNVQILRLVGTVPGLSTCSFTDVGLTILANRCRRLIRLELSGCEASFAGIAAIGQCCLMLEELTLSSTGFQEGWVAALGYFQSLKTLRLENSRYVDRGPGPSEHLERSFTLEKLQLVCADLRDRVGFAALLTVCGNVKELEFQDCWGLDDETFALAANCK